MRLKTWLVAALGLGSLVVLIALSMLAASRKVQDIYAQLDQLNSHHRRVEAKLKLSQNRSAADVDGVVAGLAARGDVASAQSVERARPR